MTVESKLREILAAAFRAETAANPHSQEGLSMSGLGACTRRAAYALAGIPVPPTATSSKENRAANLGTWIHAGLLPRLAQVLGGRTVVEFPVQVDSDGVCIPGHLDLATFALAVPEAEAVVVDVKSVTGSILSDRRLTGPTRAHKLQIWAYGLGLVQSGRRVSHTAVVYVGRERGEVEVFVEEFGPEQEGAVYSRIARLVEWSKAPDEAPRDTAQPRYECPSCPFRARCWSAVGGLPVVDDVQDADPSLVGGVERAALSYLRAGAAESDAKAAKALARAELTQVTAGQYGRVRVGWSAKGAISVRLTAQHSEASSGGQA
ncbi:PD-(D/E)XK nuclease family protein [Streptomyces sp. NPDC051684]|uniref:PD-(D/E)XK nuclease family protein n=1 Tax=Streptomyces sp. NPDC051684 TaxID=3365670 RepID=UPI0037B297D3